MSNEAVVKYHELRDDMLNSVDYIMGLNEIYFATNQKDITQKLRMAEALRTLYNHICEQYKDLD